MAYLIPLNIYHIFSFQMILICTLNLIGQEGRQKNNKELPKVKKWLDFNKQSLNVNKTNFVIFQSPNKPVHDDICKKLVKW